MARILKFLFLEDQRGSWWTKKLNCQTSWIDEGEYEGNLHNILSLAGIADAANKNIFYQSLLLKIKLEDLRSVIYIWQQEDWYIVNLIKMK